MCEVCEVGREVCGRQHNGSGEGVGRADEDDEVGSMMGSRWLSGSTSMVPTR